MRISWTVLSLGLAVLKPVSAVPLDIKDNDSINSALGLVVQGMMDYYNGNSSGGTPGMFQPPYFWWEAGVAWTSLLEYTYLTQNDTYTDLIKSSILFQTGDHDDFMPQNQTTSEGNDDQGFWAELAITAAERNFSNPLPHQPQYLALAQAVFNEQASRWDPTSCGGGLRWQIFQFNSGYTYKNSVANGCMFNVGARLARFTGNTSYVDWCDTIWDWESSVKFIDAPDSSGSSLAVRDGADISTNCTKLSAQEYTYNSGLFLAGAAALYSATNDTKWLTRAEQLWERASVQFFQNNVMLETACQPSGSCNNDQRSFKGIMAHFMGLAMQFAPTLQEKMMPFIEASAQAAAASCSGGTDGHTCGLNWLVDGWDNVFGLGEQICAVNMFNQLLVLQRPGPLTAVTGGSSEGNAAAGTTSTTNMVNPNILNISTGDRAGAGIVTLLVLLLFGVSGFWMLK